MVEKASADLIRGRHSMACFKGEHKDCGRYVPNVACHCICHEPKVMTPDQPEEIR